MARAGTIHFDIFQQNVELRRTFFAIHPRAIPRTPLKILEGKIFMLDFYAEHKKKHKKMKTLHFPSEIHFFMLVPVRTYK